MINYQTITIDLQPDYREPVVQMYLSESDVGRPIQVNVLMQGQPYSFTAGTTVHIDLRKPSGHVVQVNGNYAVGSNVVLFNVVEQMAAEPGMCLTELSIVGDGQDPIGSKNWLTKVEISPMHAGDPSETWIEDLDELVQDAMEGHIDATLSIPGDAADAAAVGEELADLQSAVGQLNDKVFEYHTAQQSTSITGTSIAASTHVLDLAIAEGMAYTLTVTDPDGIINPNSSGKKAITVYWADSEGTRASLGTIIIGQAYPFSASDDIAYFTAYKAANTITPPGNLVVTCVYTTPASATSLEKEVAGLKTAVDGYDAIKTQTVYKSQNLFNPSAFVEGYYINASGNKNSNASYGYTDLIPVTPGDVLYWNCGNARFICAYNSVKAAVSASGSDSEVASGAYTVPSGIAYVVLTFALENIPDAPVVNVGSGIIPYDPYGAWYINTDAIKSIPASKITDLDVDLGQVETLLGADSITASTASLASGTALTLTDAPWFIKKNHGITARMKFSSFTDVTVGKGYESYRGKWIAIDGTNITPYSSDGTTTTAGTPIPHGITISDYLMVSMYVAADGKCRVGVNSTGGTFSIEIDYAFEWNYAPFVFGGQAMTDVKVGYSCADLRSPLWMFGDSYLGVAVTRVAGQLKNLGYFNYLLDGIAGGRAVDTGTPGKSLSVDLTKMLAIAKPKYIVWTLGMNGSITMNISYIGELIAICAADNIELILYMPPSVPGNDKTELNTYIASTGMRYINAYDAVGATSAGVWYEGFLSTDDVHPSSLGAKALAMRFVADVPELMQYGYSTGSVDSDIDGDDHN